MVLEPGSGLIVWVKAEPNGVVRGEPLVGKTRKSWFKGRLGGTLFDERIVGCAPKVSQCPTLVRNEKTYDYISIDNIQLV